jgi:ferredoxin--NADP+ reductase
VVDPLSGQHRPGEYVAGWIKRGPSGVIGTNKPDARETVDALLADIAGDDRPPVLGREVFERLLAERCGQVVTHDAWRAIDAAEVARGKPAGRPRDKFTDVASMLEVVRHRDGG